VTIGRPVRYCAVVAGVAVAAFATVSGGSTAASGSPATGRPQVLTVFAGGSGTPFGYEMRRAFERRLAGQLAGPIGFQSITLGLTGEGGEAYEQALVPVLSQRFPRAAFDLVLVQRVEALSFVLRHRAMLFPDTPIVFMEVYEDELTEVGLPEGVTGVVTVRPLGTVPIALDLLPDTKRFVVVAGASPVDAQQAERLRRNLGAVWPALDVEVLAGRSLDEQVASVAKLPPGSLILFSTYHADASGGLATATEAVEEVSRAANAPAFGFDENFLGFGLVGGELLRLETLAERAADLASRVLKGTPPSSIPPVTETPLLRAFDARQLERWRIDERRLPAGSVVRFRDPTLWTTHKWELGGLVLFLLGQSALIGWLFVERRSRRTAQVSLADAEQRYRTVADFAADWEYWMLADGSVRYMSPSSAAITGHAADDFIGRPELLAEIVADEDRAIWLRHRAEAQGLPGPVSAVFRIRTRDGGTRWIEHVCSRVSGPDGADLGRRASNRDVTERKQAEEALRRALRENEELRDRLEVDNRYLREQLQPEEGIEGIQGESDAMRYVTSRIHQVAPTGSTVLLQGETGVGKSLLAQAIHNLSPRRARPLVTLNCAALPPALIESELFGHEKGAFTGAQALRKGRFEIADGGTLFLDEVAELPLDLQGKLLRAVQDGEFERVGSSVTRKVDVRLIAATNRKLDEEVQAGRFRQDLLYRLNVFPITVPPLRQRPDDIPLLIGQFLRKHCHKLGAPVPQVSKATVKALQARRWPGNIRELENLVERALISSRGARFDIGDEAGFAGPGADGVSMAGAHTLAHLERNHIVATLERLQWRIEGAGGAADVLGINASTLRSRMRKHGIRRPNTAPRP
jgi:formate hydrogenlyase transcriptional activator